MSQSTKILRMVLATFPLLAAAGCTQEASPPPRVNAADGPELAGAWYQVFFDTNSVEIGSRGQMIVKNVAYIATNNTATRVTVIGKTDRVGSPPANLALSQRRADAVRDALVAAGVPVARIDTGWTGETKQEVSTADDAAESRNRVVDITVVKTAP